MLPASLLPQQLYWHSKAEEYEKCEELNLKDCIECGACAFVCPSEIPLVQYYRQSKAEIRTRKEEAQAAERAKVRFEERKSRLERDKIERENRFKKAAENRRKEVKTPDGEDAIAAAIARVKAQKSDSSSDEPKVKPAVAAAIAKAKAKQAAAKEAGLAEPDNSEMSKLREERKRLAREKKASGRNRSQFRIDESDRKVAVLPPLPEPKRAKQSKQKTQSHLNQNPPSEDDPKKAVAAAIAEPKTQTEQTKDARTFIKPAPSEDDRKSRRRCRHCRAKA